MADFKWAGSDVTELAQELIDDNAMHLTHLQSDRPLFVMQDDFGGKNGHKLAKVSLTSGLLALSLMGKLETVEFVNPADHQKFLVSINAVVWHALGPHSELERSEEMARQERKQLLYHWLLRCAKDDTGKRSVREVEYAFFKEELSIFGDRLPDVVSLLRALKRKGKSTPGQDGLNFDDDPAFRGEEVRFGRG